MRTTPEKSRYPAASKLLSARVSRRSAVSRPGRRCGAALAVGPAVGLICERPGEAACGDAGAAWCGGGAGAAGHSGGAAVVAGGIGVGGIGTLCCADAMPAHSKLAAAIAGNTHFIAKPPAPLEPPIPDKDNLGFWPLDGQGMALTRRRMAVSRVLPDRSVGQNRLASRSIHPFGHPRTSSRDPAAGAFPRDSRWHDGSLLVGPDSLRPGGAGDAACRGRLRHRSRRQGVRRLQQPLTLSLIHISEPTR